MARKALIKPHDRLHVVPPDQPAPTRLMPVGHPSLDDPVPLDDPAALPSLAAVQDLLNADRLDDAAKLALAALDRRGADGEEWAAAVAAVLRACQAEVAACPPLSRVPLLPIRPDERAAQAFVQICSLLSLQNAQLDELKATIAELM